MRIGALGGLGPRPRWISSAGHEVAQAPYLSGRTYGYPPMVVYYLRHAPVLVSEEGEPILPMQPTRACSGRPHALRLLVITPSPAPLLPDRRGGGGSTSCAIDVTVQRCSAAVAAVASWGSATRVYEVPPTPARPPVISRAARDRPTRRSWPPWRRRDRGRPPGCPRRRRHCASAGGRHRPGRTEILLGEGADARPRTPQRSWRRRRCAEPSLDAPAHLWYRRRCPRGRYRIHGPGPPHPTPAPHPSPGFCLHRREYEMPTLKDPRPKRTPDRVR